MKSRLLVAALGIPLVLVILLVLPKIFTALALSALSAIAAWELLKTTGLLRRMSMIVETMIMAFAVPIWCYFGCPIRPCVIAIMAFFLLLFVEALAAYPDVKFEGVLSAMFAGLIIPACLGSMVLLQLQDRRRQLILIPVMIPFIADAGAYFAGRLFGKHKLAPTLSPHKTVEGAVGGVLVGVASMLVYGLVMELCFHLEYNYPAAALCGLVGSLVSIVGDLAFSMIKRERGVKDYGKIFLAHGGVLDRFDSVIFAAPVVELLLVALPILG